MPQTAAAIPILVAFTARRMVGTTPAIGLVTRTRVVLATWTIWLINSLVRSWVVLVLATTEVTASLRLVHLSLIRLVLGMVQFVHLSLIRLVHLSLTRMVRFVHLSLVRLVLSLVQPVNLSLAAAISSAGG